jgi:hypothetical protein
VCRHSAASRSAVAKPAGKESALGDGLAIHPTR